jgi:hypothetical protein
VGPVRPCPAAVSCAGCVLPSRPSPWRGLSPPLSTLRDKTPQPHPAGVPCLSTSPLACPWSTVARRFQHCSVSGFPLRCLRRWRPSAKVVHVQERLGPPTCFDASLPACHGLRTPADLHRLALTAVRVWPSGACTPSASAPSALSKLSQHVRVRGHPCGLQETLSTLRPSCSPCLHDSAMDARLATGGWLILTQQGLAPCKRRQAFLARQRYASAAAGNRSESVGCRQSAARLCWAAPTPDPIRVLCGTLRSSLRMHDVGEPSKGSGARLELR